MVASPKLLLFISAVLGNAAAQQLSSRAQELGLKQTWTAPMPDSPQKGNAGSYLAQNWGSQYSGFYGNSDIAFETDPITNNGSQIVMSVLYAQGSYSPSGSKNNQGSTGGTEFYAQPLGSDSYDAALLSYDLAFASNFDWKLGGKLPGIFGGSSNNSCSGGNQATGSNCFSMRLMWREAGAGEAYAYIPDNDICGQSNTVCNDEYGISFSRGVIQFKTNTWTNIELYVKINDPSESNGVLQVWQDGNLVINQQSLKYRTSNAIAVSNLMFSTFFGGGSSKYATSVDTFTYYKNLQFSVGNQVTLTPSGSVRNVVTYPLLALAAVAGIFLML
ncbi:hypothetical protein VTP01DRAFT_9575 [Rhizomucor pusillus]|uniref:uncharacterized protein n=1 Tax=Rhizomucor pusillus TaxID=4840 RepID=UPI0037426E3E